LGVGQYSPVLGSIGYWVIFLMVVILNTDDGKEIGGVVKLGPGCGLESADNWVRPI